ncbi:hypothetical protein [Pseudomonas chlororaphis]|uniref:hypothetical protein n=1 Tax=Pseudomonas chlororaphis TaxID=587753 RepID=UPI0013DDB6B6|nr:hypothetical protein [Pseudomonas chlororaphis]
MNDKPTHFRYICRACQKEIQQPVKKDNPETTDIPTCCTHRRRDMALQGLIYEGGKP